MDADEETLRKGFSPLAKSSFTELRSSSTTPIQQVQPLSENTETEKFVEGGVRAWLTVAGGFLFLFCSFGQLNSFGTFQAWYAEHQLNYLPPSTIAWIGSVQLWVFFFSGTFVGHAFDTYGPRYILASGSFITVFALMMTSLCTKYYQFMLAQGALFSLGVAMLFYCSLASVATYFRNFRATAIGLASAGSGVGGTVFPIIFPRLFELVGFAWAVRIVGFISLACCLLALPMVTRHPSAISSRRQTGWVDVGAVRDVRFVLLSVGCAFVCFGLFIPYFFITSYSQSISHVQHHDMSRSSGSFSTSLAILNAASVFGRTLPPLIADRVGPYNTLIPCVAFAGISCFALWLPAGSASGLPHDLPKDALNLLSSRSLEGASGTPIQLIIAFAVLYGFASGATIAVITPCVARISDVRYIGARVGMLYTVISIPSLFGAPAAGALIGLANGSYTGSISLAGATLLVGAVFIAWARFSVDPRPCAKV